MLQDFRRHGSLGCFTGSSIELQSSFEGFINLLILSRAGVDSTMGKPLSSYRMRCRVQKFENFNPALIESPCSATRSVTLFTP